MGADWCLEVRYENLVAAPEPVMRSVAGFLGLPFDMAMLEFHQGRTRHDPSLWSKDRWLPPTAGLRDWRGELSPRNQQLFEVLAGDVLTSLGYPLAVGTPAPPEVTATAERCEQWWQAEVDHRTRAWSRL
jgi:hypothetical protein